MEDIFRAGTKFINEGENGANALGTDVSTNGFVDQLLVVGKILVAIGAGTLTIVSMIMAIKWLIATPDKKAQLKQQLIGLVVATIVIFGAVGIWNLVQGIMEKVQGELSVGLVNKNETILIANDK